MTESHTPGPWRIEVTKAEQEWRYEIRGPRQFPDADYGHPGTQVATLNSGAGAFHNRYDVEANARLIAAAPAMLDALRAIVDRVRDGDEGYETDVPYATISFDDDLMTVAINAMRAAING